MNDPIGRAIADYFEFGEAPDIEIHTNYTEGESLSPALFFRSTEDMQDLEGIAVNHCKGRILDVGAAAGCHALELQKQGLDVIALEKSKLAADVMKKRGVNQVVCSDIFHFNEKGFDTILILMNGTGLGETLEGLKNLLIRLKSMLNKNGQILIDSSDISYLFEEEDGSVWVDLASDAYFGEMEYELIYKDAQTTFRWLYTDFETLRKICSDIGLNCKKVKEGEHFDYLAQITEAQ
ncbi:Methyltransferase domain-containing protein [Mariniphaga anaerophila]|uniref:Methyltransferase domain-containing protein n=1 Tax=Mariniphaga anaerophila TaxID=1484053 RepID=A0A1M5EY03_9BACT|nr:class I SAM-dependent methyltransferase [Mariniphaga anaerophila]SHF84153.1 Methyltransferase domain-containing protein [Mariniphaga anaerophila]